MQNLAGIDRQYEEATRVFREEKVQRAQALTTENQAAPAYRMLPAAE